eukprot:6307914-Pyramimonas_sp.AAC.1
MAKQVLMVAPEAGGDFTPEGLASALRKTVAFCESKFCEEYLPQPVDSDEEEAEVRKAPRSKRGQRRGIVGILTPS